MFGANYHGQAYHGQGVMSVSAEALVSGLTVTASVGTVTATGTSVSTGSSSWSIATPPRQIPRSATIEIRGLALRATVGQATAHGSAVAPVASIAVHLQLGLVTADANGDVLVASQAIVARVGAVSAHGSAHAVVRTVPARRMAARRAEGCACGSADVDVVGLSCRVHLGTPTWATPRAAPARFDHQQLLLDDDEWLLMHEAA